MAEKTPQEEGIAFEEWFAELFDTKPQPGSGSQWFAKLDVDGSTILWSLKSTATDRLVLNRELLREAIEHAGRSGMMPGWAGQVDGERLIVLRANDLAALFEEKVTLRRQRKADARRDRAKLPVALRHALEDEDDAV